MVETHSAELEVACARFLSEHNQDVRVIKNAWWRTLYPELRPIEHNRWLFGLPSSNRAGERGVAVDGSAAVRERREHARAPRFGRVAG